MSEFRVSLALGGGAAKGLAHVGVLRGLEEDGVRVTAIAGTSMGSIVGALFAGGMSAREIEGFFAAVDWPRLARLMVRSVRGSAFNDVLRETLRGRLIEDLGLPFAAVCCDLDRGEEVVLREGDLADAVRASSAIPGILPPLIIGGRTLVDGAMVTPVPFATAGLLDEAPVLAVNVLRPPEAGTAGTPVVERLLGRSPPAAAITRLERALRRQRFRLQRKDRDLPNRLAVVARSFHIMQYNLARMSSRNAPTIEPNVGAVGWFEFERAVDIMEAGYQAYRAFSADMSDRGDRTDAERQTSRTHDEPKPHASKLETER